MKKFLLSIMAMTCLSLVSVSCSSDDDTDPVTEQKGRVKMTFSANQADFGSTTRTTLNGFNVNWVKDDQVTVWDGSTKNCFYATPNTSTPSKATLVGEADNECENFIAVYPHSVGDKCTYNTSSTNITDLVIPTTQTATSGTWDPSAAIMTATATKSEKKFSFKNVCALLKITTTEAYKRIELSSESGNLSGTFSVANASDGEATVTSGSGSNYVALVPSSTEIAADIYYIAIAPGTHKLKLTCYLSDGTAKERIANEATLQRSYVYTWSTIETPTTISTPYYYSVSFTKKVMFTTGNLYWDGSNYKLETSQIAYPTDWSTSHVGHFYWSKTASVAYAGTYSDASAQDNDNLFFAEGNTLTVSGWDSGKLYVLTGGSTDREWFYLLNTRANASNLRKVATVDGTTCLVIAPDGYSETLQGSYTLSEINSKHLTCLPQAGWRNGGTINTTNSSTPTTDGQSASAYCTATSANSKLNAYKLFLYNGNYTMAALPRSIGSPIRLVWTVSN